jgi:uncharacterized RDD family membrane protein YckC
MQTQYQPAAQLQYVGVGRRLVAVLIDTILYWIVFFIVAKLFGTTQVSGANVSASLSGAPALVVGILFFLYYIVLEAVLGATLGKLLLGIRVVTVDGSRIGWGASIIRNLLRIVDGLPYIIPYLLGAILVWTAPQRQRLGDRVAKTVVVRR